jgi:hypothetical protein
MCAPPGQRRIYPGGCDTDYDTEHRGTEASTHQKHDDRQHYQDQAAVLPLNEDGRPHEEDQGDEDGKNSGKE